QKCYFHGVASAPHGLFLGIRTSWWCVVRCRRIMTAALAVQASKSACAASGCTGGLISTRRKNKAFGFATLAGRAVAAAGPRGPTEAVASAQ
ncbi:unnamed protein product, partial [Amoebophrya sp. A120]